MVSGNKTDVGHIGAEQATHKVGRIMQAVQVGMEVTIPTKDRDEVDIVIERHKQGASQDSRQYLQ